MPANRRANRSARWRAARRPRAAAAEFASSNSRGSRCWYSASTASRTAAVRSSTMPNRGFDRIAVRRLVARSDQSAGIARAASIGWEVLPLAAHLHDRRGVALEDGQFGASLRGADVPASSIRSRGRPLIASNTASVSQLDSCCSVTADRKTWACDRLHFMSQIFVLLLGRVALAFVALLESPDATRRIRSAASPRAVEKRDLDFVAARSRSLWASRRPSSSAVRMRDLGLRAVVRQPLQVAHQLQLPNDRQRLVSLRSHAVPRSKVGASGRLHRARS